MTPTSEFDFECEMLTAEVVDIFDQAYFWETITIEAQLEMAH